MISKEECQGNKPIDGVAQYAYDRVFDIDAT